MSFWATRRVGTAGPAAIATAILAAAAEVSAQPGGEAQPPPPAEGSAVPESWADSPPGTAIEPQPAYVQPAPPPPPGPADVAMEAWRSFGSSPMYQAGLGTLVGNPPGAEETAAFADMRADQEAYARLAADFRRYVDGFVLHWYLRRERDVHREFRRVSASELDLQRRSRRAAIFYLERFLEAHPNSPPYTVEAMYRLGDLYWEKERDDAALEMRTPRFFRTIDLYRKLLTEYPDFDRRDGVYYVLGWSLQATASDEYLDEEVPIGAVSPIDPNSEEAVAVFLTFACGNRVSYPPFRGAVAGPHRVAGVAPEWFVAPAPVQPVLGARATTPPPVVEEFRDLADPLTVMRDYFKDCRPSMSGSRFIAPTWFILGKHFAGRYGRDYDDENVEWAISSYRRVVDLGPQGNAYFPFALAEVGHSLASMNRYDESMEPYRVFMTMLAEGRFGEYQVKAEGQRRNVLIGIATNLIYDNWLGDRARQEPATRVSDPELIPQDAEWFQPLMETLVDECCEAPNERCDTWQKKAGVYRLFIQRFPAHPKIPSMLRKLVDLYRENPDERGGAAAQRGMLEAIECLALFRAGAGAAGVAGGGGAPGAPAVRNSLCPDPEIGRRWWDENRDNPELVQEAEEQAETALQDAAGQYHGAALTHQANCDAGQQESCRLAVSMFEMAAEAYRQVLREYPSSTFTYENMYNLAECYYMLGRMGEALAQYVEVENSTLATHHQRDALYNQVVILATDFASRGQQLIPQDPPYHEDAEGRRIPDPIVPMPATIESYQSAMMRWMERYPDDPDNLGYRRQIASQLYFLGHWERAEQEYQRLFDEQCGNPTTVDAALDAWQTLRALAEFRLDEERATQLDAIAEERACFEGERGGDIREGIRTERIMGEFRAASERFERAQDANDPEGYREAARMLLEVVAQHPENADAAKAIRMAAVAFMRADEPVRAIEVWEQLIAHCSPPRPGAPDYRDQCTAEQGRPGSISLPEAYFYVGINAMTTFDLARARQQFERLDAAAGTVSRGQRLRPVEECIAAERPCTDAEFKAAAVRAIADTYRLQGQYAQAARYNERIIEEGYTRSAQEIAEMRLAIVRYYDSAREWSSMRGAASEYLRQYENDPGRRLDVLRVEYYLYKDAERQGGRNVSRQLPSLQRAYDRLSVGQKGIAPSAGLTAAQAQLVIEVQEVIAKTRFESLASGFREFDRYDFQYRGFRSLDRDIGTFRDNIIRMARELTTGYLGIIADFPVSPTYGTASRYRVAYIWNRWYLRWAKLQEKLPTAALSDETLNTLDEIVATLRQQVVEGGITVDEIIRFSLLGDGSPASKGITGAIPYARATGASNEWVRAAIELVRTLALSQDPAELFANGQMPPVTSQALGEGLDPLVQ